MKPIIRIAALLAFLCGGWLAATDVHAQTKHQWKFVSIIPAGQDAFIDRFKELGGRDHQADQRPGRGHIPRCGRAALQGPYEHLKVTARGLIEMSEVVGSMGFGDAPPCCWATCPTSR